MPMSNNPPHIFPSRPVRLGAFLFALTGLILGATLASLAVG